MTQDERAVWTRGWGADIALSAAIAVFMGLLGPFGSYTNGPAWQRIGYWLPMLALGLAVYGVTVRLIQSRRMRPAGTWGLLGLACVVLNGPFSWVSWRWATTIWPGLAHVASLTPLVWYFEGLITTVPIVSLFAVAHAVRTKRRPDSAPATPTGLLGAQPSEVLCLQMEDHYVRVHTASGSRLVLATLSQAIAALGRAAGLQVHRSWWVADKAVAGAEAHGRNLRLVLTNGLTAPVARTSVAAVRSAGWLERRAAAAPQVTGGDFAAQNGPA
jgi:hypothetical protein